VAVCVATPSVPSKSLLRNDKCQGQTLHRVGVYLKEPVFTHGQLYVAVSRVNNENGLYVVIEDDGTERPSIAKNIVYSEVLQFV
jgi:ATP-dependent DNA helicase PIF1